MTGKRNHGLTEKTRLGMTETTLRRDGMGPSGEAVSPRVMVGAGPPPTTLLITTLKSWVAANGNRSAGRYYIAARTSCTPCQIITAAMYSTTPRPA